MKNPSESFFFFTALIGGWAFGWFSVARWLTHRWKAGRFVAHTIGFACGFFSAIAASVVVGSAVSQDGSARDAFGPLLILGGFVYAWRNGRSSADTPPDSTNAPPPTTAPTPNPFAPVQGVTLPCTFSFSYRAQDGDYSPRTVNVTGISSSGGHTYLEGFCHDRMDSRTFRTDRILGDLTDTETGELLPVARLLSSVRTRTSMDYKPPAPAPQSRNAAREWQTAVFFAGFRGGKLNELEGLADAAGWQVRGAISHTVDYVVRNGSAGKKQLAEAENLGIPVIDEDTFRTLL